ARFFLLSMLVSPALPQTLREAAAQRGVLMGAAVQSGLLASDPSYASAAAREFSMIEAEYEMKWQTIAARQGAYNFLPGDALLAFAQSRQMRLRGHTLVWHQALPSWLNGSSFDSAQLSQLLQDYITAVVTHFRGKVFAWDVVNEALADGGAGL